jgi:hypothetical protein
MALQTGTDPRRTSPGQRTALIVVLALAPALAPAGERSPDPTSASVACASEAGQRQECPADTSNGVILARSTGDAPCLLGKTWGYGDRGIWVSDGCAGEFQLGQAAAAAGDAGAAAPAPPSPKKPVVPVETWGVFDPGKGFLVGKGSAGELSISAYALVRYVNQMPGE